MNGRMESMRGGYPGSPDFGLVSLAGRPFQFIDSNAEEVSGVAKQLHMQRQLQSHHRKGHKNGTPGSSSWIYDTSMEDAPIKAINGYIFLGEDRGGRNAGALEDAVLYSRQASGHSDTAYLFSQGQGPSTPASVRAGKETIDLAILTSEKSGHPASLASEVRQRPLKGVEAAPSFSATTAASSSTAGVQMGPPLEVEYEEQDVLTMDQEVKPELVEEAGLLPSSTVDTPAAVSRRKRGIPTADDEELELELEQMMAAAHTTNISPGGPLSSPRGAEQEITNGNAGGVLRSYHFIDLGSYEHEVSLAELRGRQRVQQRSRPELPDGDGRDLRTTATAGTRPSTALLPAQKREQVVSSQLTGVATAAARAPAVQAEAVPVSLVGLPPGSRIVIEVGQTAASVTAAPSPGRAVPLQESPQKGWLISKFQGFVHQISGSPPDKQTPAAARSESQGAVEETPNVLPAIPRRRLVPGSRRVTIQATGGGPASVQRPSTDAQPVTSGGALSAAEPQASPLPQTVLPPSEPPAAASTSTAVPAASQEARPGPSLPPQSRGGAGSKQPEQPVQATEAAAAEVGSDSCPEHCVETTEVCSEACQALQRRQPEMEQRTPVRSTEEDEEGDDGVPRVLRAVPSEPPPSSVEAQPSAKATAEAAQGDAAVRMFGAGSQQTSQPASATAVPESATPVARVIRAERQLQPQQGGGQQGRANDAVSAAIRADLLETTSPAGMPLVRRVSIGPAERGRTAGGKKTLAQRLCPCLQPKTGQPNKDRARWSRKWLSKKSNREMVEASLAASGIQSATVEPRGPTDTGERTEVAVISVPPPEESLGIKPRPLSEETAGQPGGLSTVSTRGPGETSTSTRPLLSGDATRWLPQQQQQQQQQRQTPSPSSATPGTPVEYESASEDFHEATSELSAERTASGLTVEEEGTSLHPAGQGPTATVTYEGEASTERQPPPKLPLPERGIKETSSQLPESMAQQPRSRSTAPDLVLYEGEKEFGESGTKQPAVTTVEDPELDKLAEEGKSRIRRAAEETAMKYEGAPLTPDPARPPTLLENLQARLAAIAPPPTESVAAPSQSSQCVEKVAETEQAKTAVGTDSGTKPALQAA